MAGDGLTYGIQLEEFPRHFLGRFLDAFLLALPLRAAQAVDLRLLALDADVPLHQVDLVRRDIQAVALRVLQVQIVTFRAVQQEADHAAVDADAVVDVDHQVAGGEIGPGVQADPFAEAQLAAAPPPAHDFAVTDHHQGRRVQLEPSRQRRVDHRHSAGFRQGGGFAGGQRAHAVVGENLPHPLCLCRGDDDALAFRLPLFQRAGQQFHLAPERFDPGEAHRDLRLDVLSRVERREAEADRGVGPAQEILPGHQRRRGGVLPERARLALQLVRFIQHQHRRGGQVIEHGRISAGLAHRREQRRRDGPGTPLRGGIEFAQGFDLIAKPLRTHGHVQVRGEHVQDPAPHRKLSPGFDQFHPLVAYGGQETDHGLPVAVLALPDAPH